MIGILRSEWIKFRSVRSNVLLVLAAGLVVVVVAFFAARSAEHDANRIQCPSGSTTFQGGPAAPDAAPAPATGPDGASSQAVPTTVQGEVPPIGQSSCLERIHTRSHLGDVTVGVPFALFLFGALGVQILGQEYRFNTIRPTFTAVPRRLRVLGAKLAVVSVACAVISLVMVALCALIGEAMIGDFSIDSLDHRVIGGIVLFNVGWTALGMGVGAILRQPIAAMLVLLIEGFVVENILLGIALGTGKWMPFLNGLQMTLREPGTEGLRTVTAGGVYFFLVAGLIWAIGAVLANHRDA